MCLIWWKRWKESELIWISSSRCYSLNSLFQDVQLTFLRKYYVIRFKSVKKLMRIFEKENCMVECWSLGRASRAKYVIKTSSVWRTWEGFDEVMLPCIICIVHNALWLRFHSWLGRVKIDVFFFFFFLSTYIHYTFTWRFYKLWRVAFS